jgi:hypothetical protein
LYVTNPYTVLQYDLWATNIDSSKRVVGVYDGYIWYNLYPTYFACLQLAPDGKIYSGFSSSVPFLHVIENPDALDTACHVVQRKVNLGRCGHVGLPNHPNYRRAQLADTCVVSTLDIPKFVHTPGLVESYPNPAQDVLHFSSTPSGQAMRLLILYNHLGQVVITHKLEDEREYELHIESLPAGTYYWQVNLANHKIATGKVVVAP